MIAEFAREQHGVVSLSQLLDAGLGARGVRHRIAAGRLHRVHPGVYAVGHTQLTRDGRNRAAVLACGADSALSHRSAAHELGVRSSQRSRIDVTSPRRPGRRLANIDAHTSKTLLPRDVIEVDGLRCTSPARTLLDLAEVVSQQQLERACDQAEVLRLFDLKALQDVLDRAHGRRGAKALRAVLADHTIGSTLTRHELEARFLALCRRAGIPQPEVNTWLPLEPIGIEADFLWRDARLIAETDGRATHLTRYAFENDRRRDQRLTLAGWRVVRFSYRQVVAEPDVVATTLRGLLVLA